MIKCIRAELFRCRKDKFPLAAFAFVLIGFIITTILAGAVDKNTQAQLLISGWMEQYFSTARFAAMIFYFVWYQEYKYDTRKNICTSGSGICTFYMAKLAVQLIITAVLLVWTVLCFAGCFMVLKSDGTDIMPLLNERIKGLGIFALYIVAEISVINCLFSFIKNEAAVMLIFIFVIDNLGSVFGGIIDSELIYLLSLEAGYDIAADVFSSSKKICTAAASMVMHTVIVNLIIILKLRQHRTKPA